MSSHPRRTRRFVSPSEPLTANPFEEKPHHHHERLEGLILEAIRAIIHDEASDPPLANVRVLSVNLSPDATHARIAYAFVGPLDQEHRARLVSKAALLRATEFVRARLATHVSLKKLPRLGFVFVGVIDDGGVP